MVASQDGALDQPTGYRVTPRARQDLEGIWLYSADTWSLDQADAYIDALFQTLDTLTTMPFLARERTEFTPPVRVHPSGKHLVVYRVEADQLLVIRVLGGQQDWQSLLALLDGYDRVSGC